jgi:hypothetical protein
MNGDAAQKLLERMRRSSSGWSQTDFEHLLVGFGFQWREGKRQRIYIHSKFQDLSISVPRHNSLKEWVARDAVKLVDELISRL